MNVHNTGDFEHWRTRAEPARQMTVSLFMKGRPPINTGEVPVGVLTDSERPFTREPYGATSYTS